MLYQIQAHALVTRGSTATTIDLPTFLLDSDIQGIVSVDHARRIAADMIQDLLSGVESAVFVDAVERPDHRTARPVDVEIAQEAEEARRYPYQRVTVGSIVQLYPESGHEGPHPDDQFTPPGALARVEEIDRHPNNPDFIWGIRLTTLEEGEEIQLKYQASARGSARPLGSIHRIVSTLCAACGAEGHGADDCPACA
jgi:hypothetical protein